MGMINIGEIAGIFIILAFLLFADAIQAEPPNVQLPLNNTVLEDQACVYWATTGMQIQTGRQQVAHHIGGDPETLVKRLFEDFLHRVFRSVEIQEMSLLQAKYALQTGEWLFQNIPLKAHKRIVGTEMYNRCKEDSSVLPVFTDNDLKQPQKKKGIDI